MSSKERIRSQESMHFAELEGFGETLFEHSRLGFAKIREYIFCDHLRVSGLRPRYP